ncbi:MAG TPA: hypothetical protein VMT52_00040 [Planctomycetota bacterium]|nr:hypothetical protein [Planctomycetota bacterium]
MDSMNSRSKEKDVFILGFEGTEIYYLADRGMIVSTIGLQKTAAEDRQDATFGDRQGE